MVVYILVIERLVCRNSIVLVEVVQLGESSVSVLVRFLVGCSKALHRMYIGDVCCGYLIIHLQITAVIPYRMERRLQSKCIIKHTKALSAYEVQVHSSPMVWALIGNHFINKMYSM